MELAVAFGKPLHVKLATVAPFVALNFVLYWVRLPQNVYRLLFVHYIVNAEQAEVKFAV